MKYRMIPQGKVLLDKRQKENDAVNWFYAEPIDRSKYYANGNIKLWALKKQLREQAPEVAKELGII